MKTLSYIKGNLLRLTWICVLLLSTAFAQAQMKGVQGLVVDETNQPLPGATVYTADKKSVSITDVDGLFKLDNVTPGDTLVVSYVSYKTFKQVIKKSDNFFRVTLLPDEAMLDEVVIVGYGQQKKASVVGAIAQVSTKELSQSPVSNVSNALAGRLPGMITVQRSGEPGSDMANMYIRGISTFGSNQSPLILVDGVDRDIRMMDVSEIESISILKDASATAVYGVRGANGVILITTKRGQLGKPKVTLRSEYAVLTGLRYPEYINAAEYAGLMNEARDNAGVANMAYTDEEIELFRNGSSPYLYPNVNWVDEVLKKNTTQSITNLNITGGTEVVRYFVNVGYTTQSGLYRDNGDNAYSTNSRVNRYNYRSRVDVNLTKDLSVELGVGGIIQNRNFPGKSQYCLLYTSRCV